MQKIEKAIAGIVVVMVIVVVLSATVLVKVAVPVFHELQNHGLKGVVSVIWEGNKVPELPKGK